MDSFVAFKLLGVLTIARKWYWGIPLLVELLLLLWVTYCKEENPNDLVEKTTPGVHPLEDLDSQHDGWDGEERAADDKND